MAEEKKRVHFSEEQKAAMKQAYDGGLTGSKTSEDELAIERLVVSLGLNRKQVMDFLYSLARKDKEPKARARVKIPTRPTNGWGAFVSHMKKQEPGVESAVIFRRAGEEWRNFSDSKREHWRRTAQENHPFVTPDICDESLKKKAISDKLKAIRKLVDEIGTLGGEALCICHMPNKKPIHFGSEKCQTWLEENPQFSTSLLTHCMGSGSSQREKQEAERREVQAILNKLYASATGNARVPYSSITAGKLAVKLHGPLDLDVTKPPSMMPTAVRQEIILHHRELSMSDTEWISEDRAKPSRLMVMKRLAGLAGELFSSGTMKFLRLRKTNQDHIETLHSQIRGSRGFYDRPIPDHYVIALRTLSSSFQTSELLQLPITQQPESVAPYELHQRESCDLHQRFFNQANVQLRIVQNATSLAPEDLAEHRLVALREFKDDCLVSSSAISLCTQFEVFFMSET
ncbi:hypothetical protein CAPTEDRAFT_197858 [Capitella teleta]|uniref:HMG box domain-containing protein n=1 Tax=Capitella teleta TaxID=283909 RepID=R7T389_CAPTE|nr:hypothetical protein CAPTEDRAFT_197858 [Capitella teleta]|eukprot:ELT87083.1 hypothetical protein CAPTEDRAFT_197858 [Capitella teleta]